MSNQLPLPPIIEDWISTLNNPNTPNFIKENHFMMLERVVLASNAAIKKYQDKKNRLVSPKRKLVE